MTMIDKLKPLSFPGCKSAVAGRGAKVRVKTQKSRTLCTLR